MSTPIETNTEELQDIVNRVYKLPNIGGSGSSAADLVIGLNVANTRLPTSQTKNNPHFNKFTVDDISIESGSISTVAAKVQQGIPIKVLLKEIHFYNSTLWSMGICESTHVSVCSVDKTYPTDVYDYLQVTFFASDFPEIDSEWGGSGPIRLKMVFNIETGSPVYYGYSQWSTAI